MFLFFLEENQEIRAGRLQGSCGVFEIRLSLINLRIMLKKPGINFFIERWSSVPNE